MAERKFSMLEQQIVPDLGWHAVACSGNVFILIDPYHFMLTLHCWVPCSSSGSNTNSSSSSGPSSGAKAGIAIGVIVGVAIIVALAWFFCCQLRKG